MRLFRTNLFILLLMLPVSLGLLSSANAEEKNACVLCGMYLTDYTHVKYTVTDTDGKKYITCGVQCGLILQLNLKKKFQSATMTDLFSHKSIPAEKGWYVYRSSIITDMAPGLIGFRDKIKAEKFIKGFGGELLNYQQALAKAKAGLP